MAIPTTIEELSTTAASNGPSGSDQRTLADDGLRTAYAFIKMLVSEGSNIASATTITPPSTASVFNITGTTAITTIASTNSWDGRIIYLIFAGALTFTHGSNLALPGAANITTAANDVAVMLQTSSGAWRCINYERATPAGTYTPTYTSVANVTGTTGNANVNYSVFNNVVTVSGSVSIDPTSTATFTQVGISLPIASNISASTQVSGTAVRFAGAGINAIAGTITGDSANDRATLSFLCDTDATDRAWSFIFQYPLV